MKLPFDSLTGEDCYRVKRAARDVLPRILPDSWTAVNKYENASFYIVNTGVGVIAEIEVIDGKLWAHVSVSRRDRIPSWEDLRHAKEIVLGRERKAIQVLPSEAEYVNINPNVLHLYCALDDDPLPDFRMHMSNGMAGI